MSDMIKYSGCNDINNCFYIFLAFVIKKFPDANDASIKATMAQKCKDLRMSMESRRKKTGRWWW